MNYLELSPHKNENYSDAELLAKAPLMANLYRVKWGGHNMGLLKKEGENRFLIISDSDQFIEQFRDYYQQRFDITRHGGDYAVPVDYKLIFGKVRFGDSVEKHASSKENIEDQYREYFNNSDDEVDELKQEQYPG